MVAATVSAAIPAPASAGVVVQSIGVGFKARGFGQAHHEGVVRTGTWTPIVVDLQLENAASFDGSLRVCQFDPDGDVAYDEVPVHLLASSGGGAGRYVLYILPSGVDGDRQVRLDLLDEDREAVTAIYNGVPYRTVRTEDVPHIITDELLILDISVGSGAHAGALSDPELKGLFNRDVYTARLAAGDIPEHWIGLEAVDYIIWDEADPADFKSPAQMKALADWVWHGGTLLIAASRTAGSLASTAMINDMLPVDIGQPQIARDLGFLPQRLMSVPMPDAPPSDKEKVRPTPLVEPATIVACKTRAGASAFSYYEDADQPVLGELLTRRTWGNGEVIFLGVTLHDLFTKVPGVRQTEVFPLENARIQPGSAVEFLQRVFFLRREQRNVDPASDSVYPHVQGPINFAANSAVFLILSLMLIIAYVGTATFGSWHLLKQRGWHRHSWTAFSVVALTSSFLSVLIVQSVRGFGQTVEQLSIIDVNAGETKARGSALFGLKTGTHTELDLWLPADPLMDRQPGTTSCMLRPAPVATSVDGLESRTTYADPERYNLAPSNAMIEGVSFRATLKKLEGRWTGQIAGSVEGRLQRLPQALRQGAESPFTADSAVTNKLPVDLIKAYLLYAEDDHVLPKTGAFIEQRGRRSLYAIPLGTITAGASMNVGTFPHLQDVRRDLQNNEPNPLRKYLLVEEHKRWNRSVRSMIGSLTAEAPAGQVDMRLEPFQATLLLASTMEEVEPRTDQWGQPSVPSRQHVRHLELRQALRSDTAILIGFARDPGPIRVASRSAGSERDFRVIEPREGASWTMYRVRIPVQR
ncbi:MAG: hypothetical protein FLDDKLPJ_00734 [Phycisphaerae bacterium]|nr:hypothetical protein [Phycisphaerae bacterium]